MSRMNKSLLLNQPGLIRLVLYILVVYLAMNFMVEDIFLSSVFAFSDPSAASANDLSDDEIEHQDILVFPASTHAQVSENVVPQMSERTEGYKNLANHIIITPPKINPLI